MRNFLISIFALAIIPFWTKAAPLSDFKSFVSFIISLLNLVLPILISLAFVFFIWGLAKFILRVGGDEKAVTEGKDLMLWGILALFVLLSFWGIVILVSSEFGWGGGVIPFLKVSAGI